MLTITYLHRGVDRDKALYVIHGLLILCDFLQGVLKREGFSGDWLKPVEVIQERGKDSVLDEEEW